MLGRSALLLDYFTHTIQGTGIFTYMNGGFEKNHTWMVHSRNIDIEPENDGLEDDSPLPGVYSQVPC